MSAIGSILTNSGALTALNSIAQTSQTTSQLQNELASGLAISSPSDNPAGYITAQGFTSQINGLTQATSNANQGVSLLQTAQSAIGQQIGVVQQLNSIAVQAANSTQTPAESQSLQQLVGQLTGQVSTIANQTQFNNINLLDGSFSNMQFQVGANEGQTINLSIGSTAASGLGMYSLGGSAGTVSAALNTSTTINGTTISLGAGSAASFAKQINANTTATGVTAQAASTNQASYTMAGAVVAGALTLKSSASATSGGGAYSGAGVTYNIAAAGTGSPPTPASSLSDIVAGINSGTSKTGITASTSGSGSNEKLVLTQANGKNIQLSGAGVGTLETGTTPAPVVANDVQQGGIELMSANSFSVSATSGGNGALGTAAEATKSSLSNIDVSTVSGANNAINVIKYALQGLNNQDGALGADQQRFTATIANLSSTSTNATTALGVVQDANIPAVANQLTQAQIQAQSGVAALKSSTELQQTYLSLLP